MLNSFVHNEIHTICDRKMSTFGVGKKQINFIGPQKMLLHDSELCH